MKKLYVQKYPDPLTIARKVYAEISPGPGYELMTEAEYNVWFSQQPPPAVQPARPDPLIENFMLWVGNFPPIAAIMAAARQRLNDPQGEPSASGMVMLMEPAIKTGNHVAFRAAWNQTLKAAALEGVSASPEHIEQIITQARANFLPEEFIAALVPDQPEQ